MFCLFFFFLKSSFQWLVCLLVVVSGIVSVPYISIGLTILLYILVLISKLKNLLFQVTSFIHPDILFVFVIWQFNFSLSNCSLLSLPLDSQLPLSAPQLCHVLLTYISLVLQRQRGQRVLFVCVIKFVQKPLWAVFILSYKNHVVCIAYKCWN